MNCGSLTKSRNGQKSSTSTSLSSSTSLSKKTLDIHHNNKVLEFQAKTKQRDNLQEQLIEIETKISQCPTDENAALIQEAESIKLQIEQLDNSEDEVEYLVNTAPILFKYYDIIEKGSGDDSTIVNTPKITENSVLKWLMKTQSPHEEPSKQDNQPETPQTNTHDLTSSSKQHIKQIKSKQNISQSSSKEDRASLLEKYMSYTDDNFIKPIDTMVAENCRFCGSTNQFIHMNDGFICCNDCSCIEYVIVDHDRPSYKDPPREVSYFAYKRINHFNECLSQIQGKETTDIPDEVYDAILLEIKKQRITNMANLSVEKVREILKKLNINKYYEHAPHIKHKLNGLPIQHLEPELEDKLRAMFKMIQQPFLKHMPSNRKNFLSYSYVLHKLIQLLEKDEYLPNFSLLKSREKLHHQDQIWKKICEELNWQFIRSI